MNKIIATNRLLGLDTSNIRVRQTFEHKGCKYFIAFVEHDNISEPYIKASIHNIDLDYDIDALISIENNKIVETKTRY